MRTDCLMNLLAQATDFNVFSHKSMQHLDGFLGKIYPVIQKQIEEAEKNVSYDEVKRQAEERRLPLVDATERLGHHETPVAVIAEIKRVSPSLGDISNRNILAQVQAYVDGGAAAISVLTEQCHFKGSLAHLTELKTAFPHVPFLRKDFIVSEYQVYESKAAGADMLLLITRWLEDDELRRLHELTRELGMQALVETEIDEDMQRARALGAEIIGINARNLVDLSVDTNRVTALARTVRDKDFILVGESGVDNPSVVRTWHEAGVDVVLVGGALMKTDDPVRMVREFSLI